MADKTAYLHITLPDPPNNSVLNNGSTLPITLTFRESNESDSKVITAITAVNFLIPFSKPDGTIYDGYKVTITSGIVTFNFTATTNHLPNMVHINPKQVFPIIIGADTYFVQVVNYHINKFMVISTII